MSEGHRECIPKTLLMELEAPSQYNIFNGSFVKFHYLSLHFPCVNEHLHLRVVLSPTFMGKELLACV